MATVKQQVLNWLYSVLTSEYKDVNRTYNDVAQTLSHYSSLSPRTDVYTYEHGASALLLHLSGTLPVIFRGTTYRFPIDVWIPYAYPHEPPLAYVTPVEGMMVRPGQHVDPQGKIYHPYLVGWAEYWDKSNVLDFIAILREIFAKEPPVISRHQQNAPQAAQNAPQAAQQAPPRLPPPPGVASPLSASSSQTRQQQPPPPPPKPTSNQQSYAQADPSRRESGLPPPPLPPQVPVRGSQYGPPIPPPPNGNAHAPQRSSILRYESAPPLSLQAQRQQSLRESYNQSPVSTGASPGDSHGPTQVTQQYQQQPQYNSQPPNQLQQKQHIPPSYAQQQLYPGQPPHWQQLSPQNEYRPQLQAKPPPPPDLMDGPLTLPIPSESSTNLPAPPVPPNPEKDMLLHNIGRALVSQRQHTRSQTTSSLPGLESQHKAMLNSLSNMQAEIKSLESLTSLLISNTNILHTSLHDADAVIESSQHRTAPNIDEILVAPTVVGNQLYELVSEERSLGDALFVLGRAVERGVVSPAVFAKMTRSLAREWYLKKALAKKIGRGMGLTVY